MIIKEQFDEVNGGFKEGFATVKTNKNWGYIDCKGNVIASGYDQVFPFHNGLAEVRTVKKSFSLFTALVAVAGYTSGTMAIGGPEFNDALLPENTKRGYINQAGKEVVPTKYDFSNIFHEGLAAVEVHDKWGVVDKSGIFIVPEQYEKISSYRNGFAQVKKDEKWGFIDKKGNLVTPIQYDEVSAFNDELAAIKVGDKWGFIDTNGKMAIPLQFDDVAFPSADKTFLEEKVGFFCGFAKVKMLDKWGVIDTKGKFVVKAEFDSSSDLMGGSLGLLAVKKNGKWGYMDTNGKMVINPQFSEVGIFWNQTLLDKAKRYYHDLY